jgi:hypothetical protein
MAKKSVAKSPQTADVAISTETPCTITRKNQVANVPNRCFDNRVVDVSGFALTDNSGQLVFRLSDFICPAGEVYSLPINVLATARSKKPFFLTVDHRLINNNKDVEITVCGWDANGAPAPQVPFNWRCRVQHPLIIL